MCNPLRLQSMELSWIYQSASNSRGEDKKTSGPKSCSLPNHQRWGPQGFPRSMCCLSENPNHHQQKDLILPHTHTRSILVAMPIPTTFFYFLFWLGHAFFSIVSLLLPTTIEICVLASALALLLLYDFTWPDISPASSRFQKLLSLSLWQIFILNWDQQHYFHTNHQSIHRSYNCGVRVSYHNCLFDKITSPIPPPPPPPLIFLKLSVTLFKFYITTYLKLCMITCASHFFPLHILSIKHKLKSVT